MNNWRLLLLAVVAVFQPIASFTDSNLIDGRQQCCDRLSTAPLQDTRSSLHGTYRLDKTTSALRRLNDRDETREVRRYELRQRVNIFSRPSSERPLDIRGRVVRQIPSEIARSSPIEFRLERSAISLSRERLDINLREEAARSTGDLHTQDLTRRVVDGTSRDALERRNVRIYTKSPRDSLFRNDYRTERFGNERLSKHLFDSQREMQRTQFRSVERRITLNRDARRVLSRSQDDLLSIESSNNMNNQHIARERSSAVLRESTIRPDTRRISERNYERRDLQRNNEQSITENTRLVDRIRDMRIRLNAREDNRENRQRGSSNQPLSAEKLEERREQREDRSKENIERSASSERRIQVARRITRESRIINVMTTLNERSVDGRREIRHKERMSREIQDQIRENPDHRLSPERILMDRRNIRESRIMNARNKRDVSDERVTRHNERMTRETQDENRENQEEALSHEIVQMDRRNIREPKMKKVQNKREVASRREVRHNERMTLETRDENRENQVAAISRERIEMGRRNIRESRIMNGQNKREVDGRREIKHNERFTRETRKEIKDTLEQRLSRERILEQRETRDSRNTNTRNVRNEDDRQEIRHSERNTRDKRENDMNRHSVERTQVVRSNIREFRVINNVISHDDDRRIDSKRETKFNNRMSRETRDETRINPDHRLSLERVQMDRRNIHEFRTLNIPNNKDIDNQREIMYNRRSTELRKEVRLNPDQRISRERIHMDRRDIREIRNVNIFVQTERDTESRREIRTDARLHTENRENLVRRLSRERVQMDRRNNRKSRNGNTLRVKDLDSRQEISYNERLTRETRDELGENPERRIARESRQVERRNIRKSRVSRVVTRNELNYGTDAENRREFRNDERLPGHIRGDQIIRERRLESRSADRVNAEDRDNSMMDRRARSADRRNFREIRSEPRRSRSIDSERRTEVFRRGVEHSHTTENRDEMGRNRERISSLMVEKMETENDYTIANWQYALYTLQAAYLCALFMQMLTPSRTEKARKISLRWLPASSHYNPIKVD